jgi:hypothetical protein
LCSLRFFGEMSDYIAHRTNDTLGERPQCLVTVKDNCVGQNKSQVVFQYCTFLIVIGLYDRVVAHFLGAGHSHMVPDRLHGNAKAPLRKRDINSPIELVAQINTVACIDATNLAFEDTSNALPFWGEWESVFKEMGIVPIPALGNGGYTANGFFEFNGESISIRPGYTLDAVFEHVAMPPSRREAAWQIALQRLFGADQTLATATLNDVKLRRVPLRDLTQKQNDSIAEKLEHIPSQYHHHYPKPVSAGAVHGDGNNIVG